MKLFGLYILYFCLEQEIDYLFVEFGLYIINEKGMFQVVDILNNLFVCFDLENFVLGLEWICKNDYFICGIFFYDY